MNTDHFKSLSLYLKEQFAKLDYSDFYPEIKKDKLQSLVSNSPFWQTLNPEDSFPNWIFIATKSANLQQSGLKIGVKWGRQSVTIATSVEIPGFDPSRHEETQILPTNEIGINHKVLFNALEKALLDLEF